MGADTALGIGLDMSDVAKALARLPEMTSDESEKAIRALTKSFDRAKTESKRLTAAIRKNSKDSGKAIEESAGKAGQSASKLAGALGMVSPELEGVARVATDAADALEVVGGASTLLLGPIGLAAAAVAALGAAYAALSGNLERAQAAQETAASVATQVQQLAVQTQLAKIDEAVATGRLTEAEARREKATLAVADQVGKLTTTTGSQVTSLKEASDAAQKWKDRLDKLVGPVAWLVAHGADQVFGWSDTIEQNERATKDLTSGLIAAKTTIEAGADATEHAAAATQASAEAKAKAAAASAAHKARLQQEASVLSRLTDQGEQARLATLTGIDLIDAKRDDELAKLDDVAEKYKSNADIIAQVEADKVAVTAAAQAQIDKLNDAASAKALAAQEKAAEQAQGIIDQVTQGRLTAIEAINKAETDTMAQLLATDAATQAQISAVHDEYAQQRVEAEQEARDAAAQAAMDYATSVSDVFSGLTDAIQNAYDQQTEHGRAAAAAMWAIQKAAAESGIIIDTASGIMDVWATWAANPVIAAAMSAAVAITGGIQAGIVAAEQPSFHIGGIVGSAQIAPDERSIKVLTGEARLNRAATAALGPEGVAALNDGRMLGSTIVVEQRYKHRVLDRVVYDNVKMPSSPLRQAIKGKSRVGHRSR